MTAQIADAVQYLGRRCSIAGIAGQGLFDPRDHGLQPTMMHTACYRGFHVLYEVAENQLRIHDLTIRILQDDAPALFGKTPELRDHNLEYRDLAGLVPFTGGLLLGDQFIRRLYVHMGFHPAWKYEFVHELVFDNGAVIAAHDRSEQMQAMRERIARGEKTPDHAQTDSLEEWVKRTFELDYRRSVPPDS